jgi:hypothetical protein
LDDTEIVDLIRDLGATKSSAVAIIDEDVKVVSVDVVSETNHPVSKEEMALESLRKLQTRKEITPLQLTLKLSKTALKGGLKPSSSMLTTASVSFRICHYVSSTSSMIFLWSALPTHR